MELLSMAKMISNQYDSIMNTKYNDGSLRASNAYRWAKYARFLNKSLKIGMFVPCDLDGNVLNPPIEKLQYGGGYKINENEIKKFQEAKNNVLFQGWSYKKDFMGFNKVYNSDFQINLDTLDCEFYIDGMHYEDFKLKGNTIESLSNQLSGIILTENAEKQLEI